MIRKTVKRDSLINFRTGKWVMFHPVFHGYEYETNYEKAKKWVGRIITINETEKTVSVLWKGKPACRKYHYGRLRIVKRKITF